MSDRRRLLQAVLRNDLESFIQRSFLTLEPGTPFRSNWHLAAICHQLQRVARGECRRLVINVPPRSLKSLSVSVAFPAWLMGHDPAAKVMCISYARDLARKHALDFRTIVESPWFRDVFPGVGFDRRRQRDTEMITTRNGHRLASSMGGAILGRGADLIIIDDPIKPLDALSEAMRRKCHEAYDNTIFTRLNDKTRGAIIVIMQRLHEDDLVGHILEREDWELLSIPAIEVEDRAYRTGTDADDIYHRRQGELLHPEREPQSVLDGLRRTLGSLSFSAQYQQLPLPAAGNVIQRSWLRFYDAPPESFDLVVVSWDTASTIEETADWSVGTVWGLHQSEIYLLDVIRHRHEVPDLRREIIEVHRHHRAAATLIEDTDIGRAIGQDLRRSRHLHPILPRPNFDKKARLLAQAPRFEAGQVLLPREAPWLATYLDELLGFPNAKHDDQVDSTSQALRWLWDRISSGTPPVRPTPARPPGTARRPAGASTVPGRSDDRTRSGNARNGGN